MLNYSCATIGITFELSELRTESTDVRARPKGTTSAKNPVTHYVNSTPSARSSRSNSNELHKVKKGTKVLRPNAYLCNMKKEV